MREPITIRTKLDKNGVIGAEETAHRKEKINHHGSQFAARIASKLNTLKVGYWWFRIKIRCNFRHRRERQ
jgi:hypothetical protein